jgi:hypothetical protein
MFTLNSSGLTAAYAVLVLSDGAQTVEQVYTTQTGAVAAAPVNLGYLPTKSTCHSTARAFRVSIKSTCLFPMPLPEMFSVSIVLTAN